MCVEHWEGTEAACGECPPVLWECTHEWGHELNRVVPWATLGGNKCSTMDLSLAKYGILLLLLAHAPCWAHWVTNYMVREIKPASKAALQEPPCWLIFMFWFQLQLLARGSWMPSYKMCCRCTQSALSSHSLKNWGFFTHPGRPKWKLCFSWILSYFSETAAKLKIFQTWLQSMDRSGNNFRGDFQIAIASPQTPFAIALLTETSNRNFCLEFLQTETSDCSLGPANSTFFGLLSCYLVHTAGTQISVKH